MQVFKETSPICYGFSVDTLSLLHGLFSLAVLIIECVN